MPELPSSLIDRSSPVPLYFQLARIIEEEIVNGRWKPGDQLVSEPAMGEHFGVSRSVIRQMLDRLERDGIVQRRKGHGTFVLGPPQSAWRLQSSDGFFQEEVSRQGRTVESRIVRNERGELPNWAADALELPLASPGVTLERLRSVDGQVAIYAINHLADEMAETVLSLGPDDSLYERLEQEHGRRVHTGRRVVEAVAAQGKLANLLELEAGAPLVYIESISLDEDDRPFDAFQAWLRTDRLRIAIEVSRAPEVPAAVSLDVQFGRGR
jgi:GntR family transcriptional regulator